MITRFFSCIAFLGLALISCQSGEHEPQSAQYWAIHAGGTQHDEALASCIDKNGNTYVSGQLGGGQAATFGNTSYPIENAPSPFVCKINSAGQCEWVKTLGIGIVFNRRQDIKVDEQGNVYVYGLFTRSAFSSDNPNTQGYYSTPT